MDVIVEIMDNIQHSKAYDLSFYENIKTFHWVEKSPEIIGLLRDVNYQILKENQIYYERDSLNLLTDGFSKRCRRNQNIPLCINNIIFKFYYSDILMDILLSILSMFLDSAMINIKNAISLRKYHRIFNNILCKADNLYGKRIVIKVINTFNNNQQEFNKLMKLKFINNIIKMLCTEAHFHGWMLVYRFSKFIDEDTKINLIIKQDMLQIFNCAFMSGWCERLACETLTHYVGLGYRYVGSVQWNQILNFYRIPQKVIAFRKNLLGPVAQGGHNSRYSLLALHRDLIACLDQLIHHFQDA